MTFDIENDVVLDVAPSNGAVLAVDSANGAFLAVDAGEGCVLDVECGASAKMSIAARNSKPQLSFGEVCSVEGGTITILCASDGDLFTNNGGYVRLPDDDDD